MLGSDLDLTNLSGAALANADMYLASLFSADLRLADFGVQLDVCPSHRGEHRCCKAIGGFSRRRALGVALRNPSQPSSRLGGTQRLSRRAGPDLSGASLAGADLSGLNLASTILASADLTGASLRGADLRSASLAGAFLGGTNLTGADLTGAHLEGVASAKIIGRPTGLPAPWILLDGYLFGPRALLDQQNLPGLTSAGRICEALRTSTPNSSARIWPGSTWPGPTWYRQTSGALTCSKRI